MNRMNNNNQVSSQSFEVSLAIYDLSQGMARSLSAQFLGPNHTIDIIPHTGIIVYGKEYYFGGTAQGAGGFGGIVMNATPYDFQSSHGITPIQIISLGQTNVTQQSFEFWCYEMMNNGTYAGYNYDLIERNCNNFSHDAALQGLNLSTGVPFWILDVPNRFISSPMGQMIRPILEQMQVTGPSGSSTNNNVSSGTRGNESTFLTTRNVASTNTASTSTPSSAEYNPWANLGSPTIEEESPSTLSMKNNVHIDKVKTPILDSHDKPLLSADKNVVKFCIQKLKESKYFDEITVDHESTDYDNHIALLEDLESILLRQNDQKFSPQVVSSILSASCSLFIKPFQDGNSSSTTLLTEQLYSLMLLRLLIIEPKLLKEVYQQVLICVHESMAKHGGYKFNKKAGAIRSMSWCIMSNAIANDYNTSSKSLTSPLQDLMSRKGSFLNDLVEMSIKDLSNDDDDDDIDDINDHKQNPLTMQLHQSASAFIYNFVLTGSRYVKTDNEGSETLSDIMVTIICGTIEGIESPQIDELTRIRKLLVVGKIMKSNVAAISLLADIGYYEILHDILDRKDFRQCFDLSSELLGIMKICTGHKR